MRAILLSALLLAAPAAACDLMLEDEARSRRIPARLTLPPGEGQVPLVLWSPGLGGGLGQGAIYARAWAAAGIATMQLQHPGSDAMAYRQADAAAKAAPDPGRARAARARILREAAGPAQLGARLADVALAHARLAKGGREDGCALDRVDASRLGVAGHSMGGWVAQLLAGQRLVGLDIPRLPVRAALVVSGAPLVEGERALAASLAMVRVPVLAVTGTLDGISDKATPDAQAAAMARRTAYWQALPAGDKQLLVAMGATHMHLAGTSGAMPEPMAARLGALSADFWRATLLQDPAAKARLATPLLSDGDSFRQK